MSSSLTHWDDEYARISRAASQLRTTHASPSFSTTQPHPTARQHQIRSVQSGITRLKSQLQSMQSQRMLQGSEAQRRFLLLDNLERQFGGTTASGFATQADTADLLGIHSPSPPIIPNHPTPPLTTMTQQALRHQDDMIDELAVGVARLKNQTLLVNDEARMQNRMLDEMDGDVENARIGLEAETARALKLKEDQSVWRLYMVIAGLSVLLFLLITTGLG